MIVDVTYLVMGMLIAILLDYCINTLSGRPEWFWQTWSRLHNEHKRLYPKKEANPHDR